MFMSDFIGIHPTFVIFHSRPNVRLLLLLLALEKKSADHKSN